MPSIYQGVQCRSKGDPVLYLKDPKGVSRGLKRGIVESINKINYDEYEKFRDPEILTRGIEISANHIKSVSKGYVTGTAKPLHLGRTTQLWQINVFDDNQNLISICKLTTLTLQKKI